MYIYTQTHTRVLSDREQNFSNRVRKSFPREIGAARFSCWKLQRLNCLRSKCMIEEVCARNATLVAIKYRGTIEITRRDRRQAAKWCAGGIVIANSIDRKVGSERTGTNYLSNPYFLPLLILFIVSFSRSFLCRGHSRSLPT